MYGNQPSSGGFRIPPTLIIALVMAGFAVFRYYSTSQVNPVTGQTQHISMSPSDEVAMGLQSAPQMAAEFGGEVTNPELAGLVKKVGQRLVQSSGAKNTPYQYDFHLLADDKTINAFALPGGQIFITYALFSQLENEDQLAGVLGHEIGHVVARHSAEKMAQSELTQGLTGAASVAVSGGGMNNAGIAQMVANMIGLKYGRDQELMSDDLGVRFMCEAGYDPINMIGVMEILKKSAGPNRTPEFQSSHPDPENRQEAIKESIKNHPECSGRR
jgi:beta-barrel assembly-enhancing protease